MISEERQRKFQEWLDRTEQTGSTFIVHLTGTDWIWLIAALVIAFLVGKFV